MNRATIGMTLMGALFITLGSNANAIAGFFEAGVDEPRTTAAASSFYDQGTVAADRHAAGSGRRCRNNAQCNRVNLINGEITDGEFTEYTPPNPIATFEASLELGGDTEFTFKGKTFASSEEQPHIFPNGEECKSKVGLCCEWESVDEEDDRIFCETDSFIQLPAGLFIRRFHFKGGEGYFQHVAGHALAIGRQYEAGIFEASFRGVMKTEENYCAKETGDCDGIGVCEQKPGICLAVMDPVVGCDGETYSNACVANRNGVNVLEDSPSPPSLP